MASFDDVSRVAGHEISQFLAPCDQACLEATCKKARVDSVAGVVLNEIRTRCGEARFAQLKVISHVKEGDSVNAILHKLFTKQSSRIIGIVPEGDFKLVPISMEGVEIFMQNEENYHAAKDRKTVELYDLLDDGLKGRLGVSRDDPKQIRARLGELIGGKMSNIRNIERLLKIGSQERINMVLGYVETGTMRLDDALEFAKHICQKDQIYDRFAALGYTLIIFPCSFVTFGAILGSDRAYEHVEALAELCGELERNGYQLSVFDIEKLAKFFDEDKPSMGRLSGMVEDYRSVNELIAGYKWGDRAIKVVAVGLGQGAIGLAIGLRSLYSWAFEDPQPWIEGNLIMGVEGHPDGIPINFN